MKERPPTGFFDGTSAPVILRQPEARRLFADQHVELVWMHLLPGESIAGHINPLRVIFYVLEGEGTLSLSGMQIKLKPTQGIPVERNVMRAWHNHGKTPLRLLVIKELDTTVAVQKNANE